MKFSEFKYVRPDLDLIKSQYKDLTEKLISAKSAAEQLEIVKTFNKIADEVDSTFQIVYIKNSIDTTDEFIQKEQEFLDEAMPELQEYSVEFTKALNKSPFKAELEKSLGSLIFKQNELKEKTFKAEIIPLLQEQNKLVSAYGKLSASAQIEFEDQVYNLSQMRKFSSSTDRATRKNAAAAVSAWYQAHEAEFDDLYDKMVKVRQDIAVGLGFENYIQVAYYNMGRLDYNQADVKKFREQILSEVVPFVQNELMPRRAKRLGIKELKSYDLGLTFLNGNPTPKGDRAWAVNQAIEMYDEMSPETSKFFRMLVDRELLDLDAKKGKMGGGYCTYIPQYEAPFIFANFNGTADDVDVLTHEAGHAFQVYTSRNNLPELRWPTAEGAEIHSMSMEFLAWRWIDKFFKEDTNKYKFSHLADGVEILCWIALVDHYQHEVYQNPSMSPTERKATWRKLEKQYQPWKVFEDDPFLESGAFWFRQGHIFEVPFYYIDYGLAQTIAFQFWVMSRNDFADAWNKYYKLCQIGGAMSFVELLTKNGLDTPFTEGSLKKVMDPIKAYLQSIDDSKF
ncbi:MAG TPA: M3 family oligoendopeptidase [Acholeplasma sp.]|nr:M3 family oligoendopeptidase [Acholeplasma sp.]